MASHLDFVNYVSDQLRAAGTIRSRKMFGEYGLYCNDVFFGVICDDQLFVNVTPAGEAAFPSLPKEPPYEGAKDYFLVEDVDNAPLLTELVTVTCEALRQIQPERKKKSPVKIRLARPRDIDAWMALVEEVRDLFPGLETETDLMQHRETVLQLMGDNSAVCAVRGKELIGVLLFLRDEKELCFLAVVPLQRRQHIAQRLVDFMLEQLPPGEEISVTTYREGDPRGKAARALYQRLGFVPGELTEAFGYPTQVFRLSRKRDEVATSPLEADHG